MARVLVAEDEADSVTVLTLLLEMAHHIVAPVMRGDAVLAAIDQFVPDLLILDMMMPGKDGLQIIRDLAQEHRALPVLVLTAYPLARALEHLSAAGVHPRRVSFLQKPFDHDELLANVQLALAEKT